MKKRMKLKKKFIILPIILIVLVLLFLSPYLFVNIRLIGSSNIVLDYGEEYEETGYKASVFGRDVSDKVEEDGNVKNVIGTYKIKYTYNFLFYKIVKVRKVEVRDISGPKIELTGGDSLEVVLENEFVEPGYTAVDNLDGDVTSNVKVVGEVDTTKLGEYRLSYEVEDNAHNKTQKERLIKVVREKPSNMSIEEYSLDGWYDENKLKETADKGDDYFNDFVLVGDSNIKNMYEYGLVKGINAWALPCLHAESMHYEKLNIYGTYEQLTLLEAVNKYKPDKMILNFGSFSSIWIKEDVFIAKASEMIEKLKEENPNMKIVLISLYPITKDGIRNDGFKQDLLNRCNFILLELANKYGLDFLDVEEVLKDSTGYGNPNYYVSDGFHLNSYGHSIVREYIKTHTERN